MTEKVDIVNENDEVIGKTTRKKAHGDGLRHRSVMFFVFDPEGNLLVTKRSDQKRFFPGYWSVVLGGHVPAGFSYEEALVKEVEEEIGVPADEYERMATFKKEIEEEKENVKLFKVKVDPDKVELSSKEFEKGRFVRPRKLKAELENKDFLPETEMVLEHLELYGPA